MNISEYKQQAIDFMNATGTTITITFVKKGVYSNFNDNVLRNIYRVKLTRNGESMSFRFGDSVYNTQNGNIPTAYDILICLTKYNPGRYADFLFDYGYEPSYHAKKIYNAVVKEFENVNRLFNDVMDDLQDIQ